MRKSARKLRGIVVDEKIRRDLAADLVAAAWPTYRIVLLEGTKPGAPTRTQDYTANNAFICDRLFVELDHVIRAHGQTNVDTTYAALTADAIGRSGSGTVWADADRESAQVSVRGYINDWWERAGKVGGPLSKRPPNAASEDRPDMSWCTVAPVPSTGDGEHYGVAFGLAPAGRKGQPVAFRVVLFRIDGGRQLPVSVEAHTPTLLEHEKLRRDLDDQARVLIRRYARDWPGNPPFYRLDDDVHSLIVWAKNSARVVIRLLSSGFVVVELLVVLVTLLLGGSWIARQQRIERASSVKAVDFKKLPPAIAANDDLHAALLTPDAERFSSLEDAGVLLDDETCTRGRPSLVATWSVADKDLPVDLLQDGKPLIQVRTPRGEIRPEVQRGIPYSFELRKQRTGWFFLRGGSFHVRGVLTEQRTEPTVVTVGSCDPRTTRAFTTSVMPVAALTYRFAVVAHDRALSPLAYRWFFSDSLFSPARRTPWSTAASIEKTFSPNAGAMWAMPEVLLADRRVKTLPAAYVER